MNFSVNENVRSVSRSDFNRRVLCRHPLSTTINTSGAKGGNMNGLTWKAEDPITSRQAANLLRDEAFESRLSSLRDVAVELLNAVDCLKQTTNSNSNNTLNLDDEVRKFEADLIRAALVRTGGNQARAARLLGVKHTTLNAKIKRYGIAFAVPQNGEEIAA